MKKIYLIAAVVALVAGFATYFFASELRNSSLITGIEKSTVVIAKQDIDADTIVTEDMFQEITIANDAITYGTVSKINDIVGLMSNETIHKGEQVLSLKLSVVGEATSVTNRLSYQLEDGTYAYTISVDSINTVANFIKEGDYVNIYDTTTTPPSLVLQNLRVLKLADYSTNLSQEKDGMEITSYSNFTFALTKEQINTISSISDMRIVLVSFVEGANLSGDKNAISLPSDRNTIPVTNEGMGEITTVTTVAGEEEETTTK